MADRICERIANGESLRGISADNDMPHAGTVCRWLQRHETFREQYAQARIAQADALFDEILTIADDGHNDWMERHFGKETSWVVNGEAVQRSKLRIDARKWMAGKLAPKKYGEKQEIEHTGANGSIEVRHVLELPPKVPAVVTVRPLAVEDQRGRGAKEGCAEQDDQDEGDDPRRAR